MEEMNANTLELDAHSNIAESSQVEEDDFGEFGDFAVDNANPLVDQEQDNRLYEISLKDPALDQQFKCISELFKPHILEKEIPKQFDIQPTFLDSGTKFLWRQSQLRQYFTGSIKTTETLEAQSHTKDKRIPAEPSVTKLPENDYDDDLLKARKLCDITQEELALKPNVELEELVGLLKQYSARIQNQVNYWLDGKEQLIMDAEMHNKMIASLVKYAQQQQEQPKGK
jgi:uncharacterized small protein (DUF1192 family)